MCYCHHFIVDDLRLILYGLCGKMYLVANKYLLFVKIVMVS